MECAESEGLRATSFAGTDFDLCWPVLSQAVLEFMRMCMCV